VDAPQQSIGTAAPDLEPPAARGTTARSAAAGCTRGVPAPDAAISLVRSVFRACGAGHEAFSRVLPPTMRSVIGWSAKGLAR